MIKIKGIWSENKIIKGQIINTRFGKFKVGDLVWYTVFPLVKHAPAVVIQEGVHAVGVWKKYLDKQGVTPIAYWDDIHDVTTRKKLTSKIKMKDIEY